MRQKHNIKVRDAAEKHHLYFYEIANIMGISESTLVKRMRHEWTEEEQQDVIRLIEEHAKEGEA